MILIISSLGLDPQVKLITARLKKIGQRYVVLNTHSLNRGKVISISAHKPGLIHMDGKEVGVVSKIYYATLPRVDAILDVPGDVVYPSEWRQRIDFFVDELLYFLEKSASSFPCTNYEMRLLDYKIILTQKLNNYGVSTLFDNIELSSKLLSVDKEIFVKPVGFPFVLTNKKDSFDEVCVTRYGSALDGNFTKLPSYSMKLIEQSVHVRAFVSQDKFFAVSRQVEQADQSLDYRLTNDDGLNKKIKWNKFILPDSELQGIQKMMVDDNINWLIPEFLIDRKCACYLIDLNPAGDWYGYFDKSTRGQIANIICSHLF